MHRVEKEIARQLKARRSECEAAAQRWLQQISSQLRCMNPNAAWGQLPANPFQPQESKDLSTALHIRRDYSTKLSRLTRDVYREVTRQMIAEDLNAGEQAALISACARERLQVVFTSGACFNVHPV